MKNKFLTLLVATVVAGSLLVGCGGSEAGKETGANKDSDVSISTESNVDTEKDTQTDVSAKIDVDLSLYTEFENGYGITDESNYGAALVDGEELQNFEWEYVNKYIKLNDNVDYYTYEKYNAGFLKSDVVLIYSQTNGEWSTVLLNIGDVTGTGFVKTAELTECMEVLGDYIEGEMLIDDTVETDGMSAEAKVYFDKIRNGVAEINMNIDNLLAENPEYGLEHLVEVDSASGLECLGTFCHFYDNEVDYDTLMETIWIMQYNKYYIEYLDETDNYVEFNFYGAKY